jgi:hypothetical protein
MWRGFARAAVAVLVAPGLRVLFQTARRTP